MTTRLHKWFALLGAFLCLVDAGYAGGIKLRYGFQSQKQYKCRTVMDVTTLQDGSGNSVQSNVSVELGMGITLTVEKGLEGNRLACLFALDTLSMQITAPDREKSLVPLGELTGKSVRMVLDTRGVIRTISTSDSLRSGQAVQAVGFDLFSKELLSRMLIFLEFPEDSLEVGESWSYSHIDTVLRNDQKMATQKTVQCTLLADSTIKNCTYRRIAFSTFAHLDGSLRSGDVVVPLSGTTTGNGTLLLSPDGIPLGSRAELDSEMRFGNSRTVKQKGTMETSVEQ